MQMVNRCSKCTQACSHMNTCGGYQITPHLSHLIEDEEQSEKTHNQHILLRFATQQSRKRFRHHRQIRAFGAPQRTAAQTDEHSGRHQRVELGPCLGRNEWHVGQKRYGYRPLAA